MSPPLRLPEPGRNLFARTRGILDEFLGEEWTLGGGTLLAGRWGRHRGSTDVDAACDPRRWGDRRHEWRPALERRLREAGGQAIGPRLADFVMYGFEGLGRLEITGRGWKLPFLGRKREVVEGRAAWTLHTSQVLAGKILGRGEMGKPRDLFDLACAARREPEELEVALGAFGTDKAQGAIDGWLKRRREIAEEAKEEVFAIRPELIHMKADPAGEGARVVAGYALRRMRMTRGADGWRAQAHSVLGGERSWGPWSSAGNAVEFLKMYGYVLEGNEAREAQRLEHAAGAAYPGPGDGIRTKCRPTLEVDAAGRVRALDLNDEMGAFGTIPAAVRWAVSTGWARKEDGPYWERTLERERARAVEAGKARTK